jgi:hypothetical protein
MEDLEDSFIVFGGDYEGFLSSLEPVPKCALWSATKALSLSTTTNPYQQTYDGSDRAPHCETDQTDTLSGS